VESYRLLVKPSAAKELEAIPNKRERKGIVAAIRALAAEPRPHGCQKLSGSEKYRVRKGSYRILYQVDDDERTVTLVKIGHRRDVYRGATG
jgi:mRNA interferase RelE/StbE